MTGYQTGANSFALDLAKFRNKTDEEMVNIVRKIALEAFKRIILRTPVDTGRARANWGVKIGSPRAAFEIEATDKSGGRTIAAATETTLGFDADGSIFMTNNLPYIEALENGRSQQMPTGMVKVTMEEMTGFINKTNIDKIKKDTSGFVGPHMPSGRR